MKSFFPVAGIFSLFLFSLSVIAQTPAPTATPPVNDESIVKISTTLIQVDATVTDKDGKVVTGLKPEDFEVYENGKKQDITNFSFILSGAENNPADSPAIVQNPSNKKNNIPIPPIKLSPEQVRRSYALVVDDLGLSFPSVFWVQKALKKFINEQMQPGDLVAIIRTGSGIGALQSFTSSKEQLLAAVDKIRWNPQSRGGVGIFAPITPTMKEQMSGSVDQNGNEKSVVGKDEEVQAEKEYNDYRNENFTVGTLGALNYIIRGMKELPGRKSLMLFSDGFQLYKTENGSKQPTRVLDSMRVLADLANRSSVVVYTLDPRGLQDISGLTGEDNTWGTRVDSFGTSEDNLSGKVQDREDEFLDSQQSLRFLAYETGGIPFINQNNINKGLQRVLDDQKGYYLIGYQPDEESFDPNRNRFNRLVIKIKRPDLRIRYRSGFFGITDEKIEQMPQTPQQRIINALASPFNSTGVNLSLYPVFRNDAKTGDMIHALVYIDAKDLSFTQTTDGKRKTNFDLVAMTFGDNGVRIGQLSKNYTIDLTETVYQNALKNGFVYEFLVPIKKAGAYQFRIVLYDKGTNKVGSASQFLEVPNLKKDSLVISNLILDDFSPEEWKKVSSGATTNESERSLFLDTTIRRFNNGSILRYGYVIYNARTDRSQKIDLQVQRRLIRDGKVVWESSMTPFDAAGQADLKRIDAVGAITLGKDLQPGNYILQIIVQDNLASEKRRFSTQYVEFEIVE
jgi:VWFA-related protein